MKRENAIKLLSFSPNNGKLVQWETNFLKISLLATSSRKSGSSCGFLSHTGVFNATLLLFLRRTFLILFVIEKKRAISESRYWSPFCEMEKEITFEEASLNVKQPSASMNPDNQPLK